MNIYVRYSSDVRSTFLKDMLSEQALASEVVEGQEMPSELLTKVVGGDIESYLVGWESSKFTIFFKCVNNTVNFMLITG